MQIEGTNKLKLTEVRHNLMTKLEKQETQTLRGFKSWALGKLTVCQCDLPACFEHLKEIFSYNYIEVKL